MGKRPPDYLEPWEARKDATWDLAYQHPPVVSEYRSADDVNAWHAAKHKAEQTATWNVWGSRVKPPWVFTHPDGTFQVDDGRGILAFRSSHSEDSPPHEGLAKWACACVNACRAIIDPVKLVADVRGLLLDLVTGKTDGDDARILACLARMIPAEELEQIQED